VTWQARFAPSRFTCQPWDCHSEISTGTRESATRVRIVAFRFLGELACP